MRASRGWEFFLKFIQVFFILLGFVTITAEQGFSNDGGGSLGYSSGAFNVNPGVSYIVENLKVDPDNHMVYFGENGYGHASRISEENFSTVERQLQNLDNGEKVIFYKNSSGDIIRVETSRDARSSKDTGSTVSAKTPPESEITTSVLGNCEYVTDSVLGDGYTVKPSDCAKSSFVTRKVKCKSDDFVEITFVATCVSADKEISANECAEQKMAGLVKKAIDKSNHNQGAQ